MLQSVNPANLQSIKTYLQMQPSEVNRILDLTNSAFEEWKDTSFKHRSRLMMKAADVLRKNNVFDRWIQVNTRERPDDLRQARSVLDKKENYE